MRKLMLLLALGVVCLLPLDGYSLGLGEIEVNSALNQELNAQIELLSAVPEDAESLIVKLGSREEFNNAGIDRPFLLQDLKFSTVVKNNVPYIKITSSKPIREPFLNFLIELDWPKGHLLREYTILLDPPVFTNEQSVERPAVSDSRPGASAAPAAAPVPVDTSPERPGMTTMMPESRAGEQSAAPARQAVQTATAAESSPAPAAYASPQRNADYRVRQGDTAWSLADSLRPDQSVSIEQMMLALLRTNPESFIKDNVNGLKRGYILRIPDRSEITSVSQADAVAMVRQQNALWREYRQAVSEAGAVNAGETAGMGKGMGSKTKTSDAHLSIVSAGKGAATGAAGDTDKMSADELRAQLALAEERLESERMEKESLQGEVSDLQKQVDKMKRLLSIEDEGMAQMQSSATASETTAQPAETEAEPEAESSMPASESAPESTESPAMAGPETESEAAATEQAAAEDKEKVFLDEQNKPEAAEQQAMPAAEQPAEQAAPEIPPMPAEIQQPPRGLLVSIFGSPAMLAAVGAGVLLLMALVYLLVKRRRASASAESGGSSAIFGDDDLASVADMLDDHAVSQNVADEEVEASMAAAEQAAEEFDSDATMILPSADDTVITHAEPAEDEARDDVIAEADVYLAYGIYQQAEELLQNAIRENPDNDAYRMKLAETYFAGKNVSGFGDLAAEMHKRTKGSGSRWQKIAAMGKDLIPGHELFKGAGAAADVALDDLVPSPEPMDIDLGLDDTSGSSEPDLDFSLGDENELQLPDISQVDTAILDLDEESLEKAPMEELEFDLSETDARAEPAAEEEFSLDFEASDLDITTGPAASEADSGMDFDLDLSAEAEADTEDEFDIDVSEELGASATIVDTASDAGGDIELSDLDDVDEVSTKLDLARAYLDMGDHEGTRSILEEVVEEGNAAQKAEAEALLAEIAG